LGVNVWLYQGWLNRFVAAAKWQEDNLGKLALPHHSFVLYPGEIRFTQILFCTFLLSILIVPAWQLGDLAVMCPGVWLLLISFSMCFAGVLPPSPGARVAKKEKAPAGLAPALSRI
jgi:hypothetical protein